MPITEHSPEPLKGPHPRLSRGDVATDRRLGVLWISRLVSGDDFAMLVHRIIGSKSATVAHH